MRIKQRKAAVERALGIMIHDIAHGADEGVRVAAAHEIDYRVLEHIVHHAVQLSAQKIMAALFVTYLVGRVFPDLADDQLILVLLLDDAAQGAHEVLFQLVHHVQPPAGDTHIRPLAHHAVLMQQHAPQRRRLLVERGRDGDSPPALVIVGEVVEEIPIRIGGFFRLIGAQGAVIAELVEISAVRARMIENAVENDAHSLLRRLVYQLFELFLRPHELVYLHIVARVVTMVGRRFEDGREVNERHAERFEIRQLVDNALQIAAVKIVGAVNAVGIAYGQRFVPGFEYAALLVEHGVLVLALVETVDEDLVDKSALAKVGRLVARTENGELPGRLIFVGIAHLASPLRV